MNPFWKNFLIGACVVAFLALLGGFNATKPRILVVNSSAEESLWSRKIKQGIERTQEKNRRPLSVSFNYLALGEEAPQRPLEVVAAELRRTLAREKPDLVIAVDDEANALIAPLRAGGSIPRIVYVSIDHPPSHYGYQDAPDVSGIADRLPVEALRDFADDLHPKTPKKIALLGAECEAGAAELAQALAFDWSPHQLAGSALVATAEDWKNFVRTTDADFLIILETRSLPLGGDNPTRLPAKDILDWTESHSKALPIGTDVQHVQDGGAISFSPPPDDYGEKAMEMAIDWLDERQTPGAPPSIESAHFEVAICKSLLKKRGIMLPPIYLEAARENGTLFD